MARFAAGQVAPRPDQTAEDVVQDVAIELLRLLSLYEADPAVLPAGLPFYTWVLKRAVFDTRDRNRRPGSAPRELTPDPGEIERKAPVADPTAASDLKLDLESAMSRLTPDQAAVVRMVYLEGMTQAEAAEVRGVSQPAVAKMLRLAFETLGPILRDYEVPR